MRYIRVGCMQSVAELRNLRPLPSSGVTGKCAYCLCTVACFICCACFCFLFFGGSQSSVLYIARRRTMYFVDFAILLLRIALARVIYLSVGRSLWSCMISVVGLALLLNYLKSCDGGTCNKRVSSQLVVRLFSRFCCLCKKYAGVWSSTLLLRRTLLS